MRLEIQEREKTIANLEVWPVFLSQLRKRCLLIQRYFAQFMTMREKQILVRAIGNQKKIVGNDLSVGGN